ncbi:hypothetical protein MRB53_038627 [Persea americana]|nr:hypothetical protein MRB53_038627 [Persea americana]
MWRCTDLVKIIWQAGRAVPGSSDTGIKPKSMNVKCTRSCMCIITFQVFIFRYIAPLRATRVVLRTLFVLSTDRMRATDSPKLR